MCNVHAVLVCYHQQKAGKGGDPEAIHQAMAISLGASSGFPLVPPASAGVAPATPTPLCCLGSGGPSAMWHAPWRGRTRPLWTPR